MWKIQVQFEQIVAQGKVLHNYDNVLELLLQLRQCCSHPSLVMRWEWITIIVIFLIFSPFFHYIYLFLITSGSEMCRGDSQNLADSDKLARRSLDNHDSPIANQIQVLMKRALFSVSGLHFWTSWRSLWREEELGVWGLMESCWTYIGTVLWLSSVRPRTKWYAARISLSFLFLYWQWSKAS